jgi:hypothetical protein
MLLSCEEEFPAKADAETNNVAIDTEIRDVKDMIFLAKLTLVSVKFVTICDFKMPLVNS